MITRLSHATQSFHASAAQKMQHHRFKVVVLVVRRENKIGLMFFEEFFKILVPFVAAPLFNIAFFGRARFEHFTRDFPTLHHSQCEICVFIGIGTEAMVDVSGNQL